MTGGVHGYTRIYLKIGVYGCLTAFDMERSESPGRQICGQCEASSEEHYRKIAEIRERLHVKMGRSVQGREKADRWMMGRRKRVIKSKKRDGEVERGR